MKKLFALILALTFVFASLGVYAEKDVKYLKSDEGYNYGGDFVYVAKDKATGELIPLSIGPYDGYSYVYTEGDFTIEKVPYTSKYTDEADINSRYSMGVREMSARGVLKGFPDGTFKPDKELSRAEMAVIFRRLFSIDTENAPSSIFPDIAENSWCREDIMALIEEGVFAKGEYFYPEMIINREQLITMAYRMINRLGGIKTDVSYSPMELKDFDSISDFAKPAYEALISNGYQIPNDMVDHDFMDTADDEYFANPRKAVTRGECADFLYFLTRNFLNDNAPAIKHEELSNIEIPILDGSTSTYDITRNIYSAFYQNHENLESFPKAHSKTTNSYKRLINGEVEMIFVPDPGEEVLNYAKKMGVNLRFVPIANEALVFFTDKDNKAENITTEALHEIYVNNGITNWKEIGGDDKELVAYCRNNDSGSHAQMENFILGGKPINEKIAQERISLIMASILTDVDDFNAQNPDKIAMGYSLYYYFNNVKYVLGPMDLKLMSIDGIAPTDETIGSGTYPYTTNYYAVVRDEKNEKVDKFISLMQGEFGQAVISQSGLGVIK